MTSEGRIDVEEAANRMNRSCETIRRYIRKGWLSATVPSGLDGTNEHKMLDPDEVAAFMRGGAPAAAAYRAERDAPKIPVRKGRRPATV